MVNLYWLPFTLVNTPIRQNPAGFYLDKLPNQKHLKTLLNPENYKEIFPLCAPKPGELNY